MICDLGEIWIGLDHVTSLVNVYNGQSHFQWENPLFLWPCSIAMLNYQRVHLSFWLLKSSSFVLEPQWNCQSNVVNVYWSTPWTPHFWLKSSISNIAMEKMSTEFDDSPFKNGDFPPQSGKTFAVYSFASAFFSGSGGADPATETRWKTHGEIEEIMRENYGKWPSRKTMDHSGFP